MEFLLKTASVREDINRVGSCYYVTREPTLSSEAGQTQILKSVTTLSRQALCGFDNIVGRTRPHGFRNNNPTHAHKITPVIYDEKKNKYRHSC